ncbi:DNA mismatch repair protein MutS [Roseomonas marmotae]|uniref:DNA mismatch repair protein MutS n=2 Tax=Roseomonas marmotae TaxID=2768161 RepID=A0ABS3KGL4_9PROT|nr:DNA mismatch repair protein MutS [Roseomonas marmotae]MBO1076594.1 DNA mismatch repair protein MutS [Roseomonas marmotae]QTI79578.1 DNA mismatch repair protein MutS [Roseomonas marmotae]
MHRAAPNLPLPAHAPDDGRAAPARTAEGATPAMAQWFAARAQHPGALIFFRMGDFFELFFEDAHRAGELLGLAVSHRGEHQGQPIPMAGVPAHALEGYLARLIRAGLRVAICDQRETPEQAKARKAPTIRREVVRLVTPGTITEDALLEGARPAWLLALCPRQGAPHGGELGAAWADLSTGAFRTELLPEAELAGLLARLEPAELLAPAALEGHPALAPWADRIAAQEPGRDPARDLAEFYGVASMEGFGAFQPPELSAAAMALAYIRATQGEAAPRLRPPEPAGGGGTLRMDAATRRSLEILRSERGDTRNCLLSAVDRTLTGAGARELASRLACPLAEMAPILARHEAVACLLADAPARATLRGHLKGAPDMARALARLSLDRFAPRDLAALRDGLARAEAMADFLRGRPLPALLEEAAAALVPEASPRAELDRALAENLPARIEDGGVVAQGYDGELDALRRLRDDGRAAIAAMQLDLAQAWGVASLKIRHHQQFGYLAELPAAAGEKLLRAPPAPGPMAPVHRQTMANAIRFTCAALADLDRRLAEAGQQAARREALVVRHLRDLCLRAAFGIDAAAQAMAEFDIHAAAAELAAGQRWCRPEMVERTDFRITQGRHPVVEAALARDPLKSAAFVPNDADLSPGQRLCLLTGPNMAGKSTFLRQNAIMAVLAQAGMFVPAEAARIGLVDRLFSRVGAADDIAGGRSTFMVEMTETAAILNQATQRSLVVLDEVGRGTATWDGLAIGWAVLEALHDRIRCRAIFATHFHELTALTGKLPELAPATMKVREHRGEVVFLHLVAPGASERSWGLHVARLAGVPREVVMRATAVLAALEERARGLDPLAGEMPLFARAPAAPEEPEPEGPDPLRAALEALDPDVLTPRAALEALYRLKSLLR